MPRRVFALRADSAPVSEATPAAASDSPQLFGDIEDFLQTVIADLAPDPAPSGRPGPGRPRILPAVALWAGLVVCVLRGFTHQADLWRLLTRTGLWSYPRLALSDQAIYRRLARVDRTADGQPASPLQALFERVTQLLATRLSPFQQPGLAPFATAVLCLDETTLDRVARSLPALRPVPAGDRHLLPGKLTALFDIRRQQVRRVVYQANPAQNEKVAARSMLAGLARGCLLLADLGYFAFQWFDDLTDAGHWWISRLRARTSFRICHVYFDDGRTFDGLVWLGAHRADRSKHPVRLVRFQAHHATHTYLTNVLDPHVLSLRTIAQLYARRWDIELAFKTIKRELGLHLLWSAKPLVILHQVWAVLLIAQILQALRLEIAARAEVDPFEVSVPLLIQYLPQYAQEGVEPLAAFVAAGRRLGFIRPSSRTQVQAPHIPLARLIPKPPDLLAERVPRYAHKGGIDRPICTQPVQVGE